MPQKTSDKGTKGFRGFINAPNQEAKRLVRWKQEFGKKLTAMQKEILKDLGGIRPRLKKLAIKSMDMKLTEVQVTLKKEYDGLIRSAIRRGLQDHPWCSEWIAINQAFGHRKALHALHRTHPRLEKNEPKPKRLRELNFLKDIPKPIRIRELQLLNRIFTLKKEKDLSLRSIHKYLLRNKEYTGTWSSFRAWLNNPLRQAITAIRPDKSHDIDTFEPDPID